MERINISDKTNFIGCWNLKDENLCKNIINFFEKNKQSHVKGVLGKAGEVDESRKKSIDMNILPKDLNKDEFKCLKDYMYKLFDCYQDYKEIWPFLNETFPVVDVPSFNIQKYEKGGHFGAMHCERDGIAFMHRVFAWMTYLNNVEDGGETYFEHFRNSNFHIFQKSRFLRFRLEKTKNIHQKTPPGTPGASKIQGSSLIPGGVFDKSDNPPKVTGQRTLVYPGSSKIP